MAGAPGTRARRLRAVCVRTAADLVSSVTTSCRSTWAVRRFPPWPASCGCAGRVIFNDTHRGGAPRGTHYSLACAEVEWLPSCFRFGVGVVTITTLIGRTRRPPAVFSQYFEPFAIAGLSTYGDRCRAKSWCRGRKWNTPGAQSGHRDGTAAGVASLGETRAARHMNQKGKRTGNAIK